jgi:rod shape-determining protein MreC
VPRHRTARTAVLGVSVRRPATGKPPSRSTSAFRRRLVVGILVMLALVLITFSFRKPDSGPVAAAESAAASALRPFTIAGERVAQPFRDAYEWADSLLTARSDAKRLREETEALRQQVIQNQFAGNENARLKALLAFRDGPRFPDDYKGLAAAVIARPSGTFAQEVVVAAGSNDGVALDAPVVTADGFLGRVTRVYSRSSRVTLLSDEQLAVSAIDVKSGAAGIVKHGRGTSSTLIFDRVPKKVKVSVGDTIVTAGWRSSRLASLYPKGIPIGRVTSVGQADTDLWKQIQVEPFADFERVDAVLVLVLEDGQK